MNKKILDWRASTVWVIGASSGIGAATARLLLDKGAQVVVSARTLEPLQQLCQGRANALAVALDIVDHASLQAGRDTILAHWPRIDLVLIVAGGYNEMRADSFDLTAANRLIDLNLRGVFNCLDVVLPLLLQHSLPLDARAGAPAADVIGIGIVASVAGYGGLPKALVYGATKAALINLTESLYFDLHPRGIGVYQINPGFVDTPLTVGNNFKMPALMSAEAAAQELVLGMERGQFHIHFPKRLSNPMRLARLLPYRLYFWLVQKVTRL